ncbi:hypothetical protein SB677_20425, partial [Bacillus sp. SIMBA_033]
LCQQVTGLVDHRVNIRGGIPEVPGPAPDQGMDLQPPIDVFEAGLHQPLARGNSAKFQAAAELNPVCAL